MIHTDEDDEFERIERENAMKGQPYHFEKREWVGLTDEEILEKCESVPDYDIGNYDLIQFARAIEDKIRSKNETTRPLEGQT